MLPNILVYRCSVIIARYQIQSNGELCVTKIAHAYAYKGVYSSCKLYVRIFFYETENLIQQTIV